MGVVGHAREEKIPGEAWIKVKISNQGRETRRKTGVCSLSNRHEYQRTQGMTKAFQGLNGIVEVLISCGEGGCGRMGRCRVASHMKSGAGRRKTNGM